MRDDTPFLRKIMDYPHEVGPRLVFADWLEERGDGRMARAWRWMACMAKWPDFDGWWPRGHLGSRECHRLPIEEYGNVEVYSVMNPHDCEQALADALEMGDL